MLKQLFQHYPENEPIEESRLAYATPEINIRVLNKVFPVWQILH